MTITHSVVHGFEPGFFVPGLAEGRGDAPGGLPLVDGHVAANLRPLASSPGTPRMLPSEGHRSLGKRRTASTMGPAVGDGLGHSNE